jgi:hypothetical protein
MYARFNRGFIPTRVAVKKWRELPEYVFNKTGSLWNARRVEASRARLRRLEDKLRNVALARFERRPRLKVWDGVPATFSRWGPLNGLLVLTSARELKILRESMFP